MKHNGVIHRKLELIADNTRKLRALLPLSVAGILANHLDDFDCFIQEIEAHG